MKHQMKRAICIVSVCLVLAALVRAFMIETSETILVSDELMISSDEWSERQIELNGKKVLEYNCNIPRDAAHRLVLAVKTYNSQIEVLLNKEKIYTYEDLYDEKGYYWKWIKLPEDISEQTLTLRISYDRENATPFIKHNLYLGEHNAVLLRIFQKNLYGLFWGGITILTGIFVGLASLALRKRIVNDMWKGMHYLAVFILLAGIWILTDSSVMQFITGKTAFVSLVSFLSFMFMPYFFLLFIEKMMFDTKRIVRILSNLHLINTVVCVFLYLFRLLPLHQTLM